MARVLLTASKLNGYGAPRMLCHYASALTEAGHEVHVAFEKLAKSDQSPVAESMIDSLKKAGASLIHVPKLPWAVIRPKGSQLARVIRKLDPKIIIATQLRDAAAAMKIARYCRIPGIVFAQNQPRLAGNPISRWLKARLYKEAILRNSDGVICVGPALRDFLVQHLKADPTKISVITNGLDMDNFPAANAKSVTTIRRDWKIRTDEVVLVNLARFHEQKGQDVLVTAVHRLLQSGTLPTDLVFRVVLVGDARTPQARQFQRLVERLILELKLERHVLLAGFRSDCEQVLYASDGFVLSSRWEGFFPLAAQEACAARRPCVITEFGGRYQGFEDGTHGFYVPVDDVDRMAEAIRKLLMMSSVERDEMGRHGRNWIDEHLSLSNGKQAFVKRVGQILGGKPEQMEIQELRS